MNKCRTCKGHGIIYEREESDFYDDCPDCDGNPWPQDKADALDILRELPLRTREAFAILAEQQPIMLHDYFRDQDCAKTLQSLAYRFRSAT